MAKTILPAGSYTYNPGSQQVDFTNFTSATGEVFNFSRLYAIIDVIAGQIIYTTSGTSSGYGGTYSAPTLTLSYNTTGFSGPDLQIIYDLANAPSATYDGTGTQPILSSTDPITGREGLDINLLNSSFGGQLTLPLPSYTTSGYNAALSVGFINGGNLVAPNMDAMTNNLIVDINSFPNTGSALPVTITSPLPLSTSFDYWQSNPVSYTSPPPFMLTSPAAGPASFNQGATDAYTLRVAANQYTSSGFGIDYGAGQSTAGTTRAVAPDYTVSGPSGLSGLNVNILLGGTSAFATDGYRFASVQINSTATAGSYIFEGSNDNSIFFNIPVYNSVAPSSLPILGSIVPVSGSVTYQVPLTFRWFRVRINSALSGGTVQSYTRFSQTVPPLLYNLGASQSNPASNPAVDVLNVPMSASKYNQVEVDFNTAPSASVLTTTTSGTGSITQSAGQTLFATGTGTTAFAKGVTVGVVQYRPANEMYAYFSAAFVVTGTRTGSSYQRIGIYDTNNGFFVGYNGLSFGVTKRTGGVDTFTIQSAFNGDPLDGSSASKFTRNGIPEALNQTNANLYRVRFAWLGSASILFDVFSPDGLWVNFHTIKQPNSGLAPSLTIPNLPITLDCSKVASSTENLILYSACVAGGTTSPYAPITATLTDNTLAALNRSVITGVTTGGGGGYVNVKVNPSGALTVDSTVSSSALPTGAATETTLASINTKTPIGQTTMSGSRPVVIASDQIVPTKSQSVTTTGTITALNGTVTVSPNGDASAFIDLRGTWVATVTFQGSIDGTTFFSLPAAPAGSAQNVAAVTTTAANGAWQVNCAGMVAVRAIATAFTSGTINVTIRTAASAAWVYNAPVGATNSVAISSGTVTTVSTVTAVTSITNNVNVKQVNTKGQFVRNAYTTSPVTTGAYVQLIASTTSAYNVIEIYDSSTQSLVFAIGAAGSEVDQFIIFPGGNGRIPFTLATGQRVSVKALSANAVTGELDINFYI